MSETWTAEDVAAARRTLEAGVTVGTMLAPALQLVLAELDRLRALAEHRDVARRRDAATLDALRRAVARVLREHDDYGAGDSDAWAALRRQLAGPA